MDVRKKFPAFFQYVQRFTSSLVAQLTVIIILLISFPTLVFTLFTLQQQSAMTREELVDSSFDSTVQIANQINSELKSYAARIGLDYVTNDDSMKRPFDALPVIVNYFYHEQIKKSAGKGGGSRA